MSEHKSNDEEESEGEEESIVEQQYNNKRKRKIPKSSSSSDESEDLHDVCSVASEDDKEELVQFVNIASLLPERLLQIEVKIGRNKTYALLDTGAENNLMKRSICRVNNMKIDRKKVMSIVGLGGKVVHTVGRSTVPHTYYDIDVNHAQFEIIEDDLIDFPIILGRKWCKDQRLIIDFAKRKVTKVNDNGSRINIQLDKDSVEARSVLHENIKVYSTQNLVLKSGINEVPVQFQGYKGTPYDSDMYFDGKCKNTSLEGLEGVLDGKFDSGTVFVKIKTGENGNKIIKKGDVVGSVYTMVALDETEEQIEDTWSLEDLKENISIGDLQEEEKDKVYKAIYNAKNALSKGENDLGMAKVTPHHIELTDYTPIWQKPRSFSDPVNEEIDKQCQQLEMLDVIEKCDSPWSSPVVPVRKTDGSLRLCIDYRKLNKVTRQENFPMPNLSDAIYSGHNIKYFTKLDLIKGYYQVPIHPDSRQFTAFSTTKQQYQFKRLSFGLRNSGIQFQKNMQEILSELMNKRIIVYLDDILIMSESFEEHLQLVERVLTTLLVNGIKAKVNKCEFFKSEVTFLGHLISNKGIKKSPDFVEKILNYPKPSTVTQLRQFLGLANFQRKFIEQFSSIAKPLTCLTGGPKRKQIKWTPEMEQSFEILKEKLAEDVSLAFPDYRKDANPLELYVDASGVGAGACLAQMQEGEYRHIAFSSVAFSKAEQKYSTIERELLALRWGVKNFKSFLFGVKFTIFTDHKPLLYLYNMSRENSRLMRTLNDLEEYDFEIRYLPGPQNEAADTMSRIISSLPPGEEAPVTENELPPGFRVIEKVDGGGDTMFKSLLVVLNDLKTVYPDLVYPDNPNDLRKDLVECLIENHTKLKIKLTKEKSKYLKAMKYPNTLPCEEVLLAVCLLFKVEVWVHHGMKSPIIYKFDDKTPADRDGRVIHLQCIAGIHFNPMMEMRQNKSLTVKKKNVNLVMTKEEPEESKEEIVSTVNVQVEKAMQLCECEHSREEDFCNYVASVAGIGFCALIDTGAQVSAISEALWNRIKDKTSATLETAENSLIRGIGKKDTTIIGIVQLKLKLLDVDVQSEVPFAVIGLDDMPCCAILGANFISKNQIAINFDCQLLYYENEEGEELIYPFQQKKHNNVCNNELFCGAVTQHSLEDDDESQEDLSEYEDEERILKAKRVRYVVHNNNFLDLQQNNHAIAALGEKLLRKEHANKWKEPYLKQFKRYSSELTITNNTIYRFHKGNRSIVVPFSLLVEIVHKSHVKLGHIGIHKLIEIILKNFWHPSIDKVARDICKSCIHCQFFKVNRQVLKAPTLKINPRYPFDMVATDIMLLPKTPRNNIAVLVAIDHYSKWLMAIPIRDKKGSTVARVFNQNILPNLPKIPSRVLSDNGPEFKSKEFNEMLQQYDIKHIYSTPYKASSNGCVERSNRTIIQLLKGVTEESNTDWDLNLPKALIVHNSTIHSKLGHSPSDCILKTSHNGTDALPIDSDIKETWKVGHPKFSPYKIGHKVLKKINKVGNRVNDKLSPKFEGPFTVVKVQSNEVTYEIERIGDTCNSKIKVHYQQLKQFIEVPEYLKDLVTFEQVKINKSKDDSENESTDYIPFMGGHGNQDLMVTDSEETDQLSLSSITTNRDGRLPTVEKNKSFYSEGEVEEDTRRNRATSKDVVKMNLVPLSKLPCSEVINETNATGSPMFLNENGNNKMVTSTPKHDAEAAEIALKDIDISCIERFSDYITVEKLTYDDVIPNTVMPLSNNDESKHTSECEELNNSEIAVEETPEEIFADVMEDAWSRTIELIEAEIEKVQNIPGEDGKSKENEQASSTEYFEGFGSSEIGPTVGAARLNFLKALKRRSTEFKDLAVSFRKGNNEMLRAVWNKNLMNSESRLCMDTDASQKSTPKSSLLPKRTMVTRSTGTPLFCPNVQTKTLEYKTRKSTGVVVATGNMKGRTAVSSSDGNDDDDYSNNEKIS